MNAPAATLTAAVALALCLALAVACNDRSSGGNGAGANGARGSAGSGGAPQSGLPTVTMPIGSRTFTLEIADTDRTQEIGLMHRDSMPSDHGMIFVFPSERPLNFWMKHTRIPLDILYVDAGGTVVSIHQMQPFDLKGSVSRGPAKYAIELNQGAAQAAGVKAGDRLTLPPSILSLRGA